MPRRAKKRSTDDGSTTSDISATTKSRRRSRSPLRSKKMGKSIKGLLGLRKKKSKRHLATVQENPAEQAPPALAPPSDDATQYDLQLQSEKSAGGSAAVPPSSAGKASVGGGYALQVVLLLMDPSNRRFELLQLEFDASKALVKDVLQQIPLSATEESLRTMKYTGVCNRFGTEMINSLRLSEFCSGNEVVMAIPSGMSAKETSKLSRPILSDPKVIAMLQPAGIDTTLPADKTPQSGSPSKSRSAPAPFNDRELSAANEKQDSSEKKAMKKGGSGSIMTILFLVVLIPLLGFLHHHITSPLTPGTTLSPGQWRNKCGLLTLIPEEYSGCHPSAIEMGNDGVLSCYDGKEVKWTLKGGICGDDNEECIDGVSIADDGSVLIGGEEVYHSGNIPEEFSPWPFEVEPPKKYSYMKKLW